MVHDGAMVVMAEIAPFSFCFLRDRCWTDLIQPYLRTYCKSAAHNGENAQNTTHNGDQQRRMAMTRTTPAPARDQQHDDDERQHRTMVDGSFRGAFLFSFFFLLFDTHFLCPELFFSFFYLKLFFYLIPFFYFFLFDITLLYELMTLFNFFNLFECNPLFFFNLNEFIWCWYLVIYIYLFAMTSTIFRYVIRHIFMTNF